MEPVTIGSKGTTSRDLSFSLCPQPGSQGHTWVSCHFVLILLLGGPCKQVPTMDPVNSRHCPVPPPLHRDPGSRGEGAFSDSHGQGCAEKEPASLDNLTSPTNPAPGLWVPSG